jgi:hypothetical protein
MKTFHNIVQGVLSGDLGYGLMNGCQDPKGSHRATVEDQLYLYECDKAFTLTTIIWNEAIEYCKNRTLSTLPVDQLINLRNRLKSEHDNNHSILMDMINHYVFYRRRAVHYHNAILKLINCMNRIIEDQLKGCS